MLTNEIFMVYFWPADEPLSFLHQLGSQAQAVYEIGSFSPLYPSLQVVKHANLWLFHLKMLST